MNFDVTVKIDPESTEGKTILDNLYISSLLDETEMLDNYTVNKEAREKYITLLLQVKKLSDEGKCTYTCDNVMKPYVLHCIYVSWKDEDGYIELPTRETEKLLSYAEGFVIDTTEPNTWQLSIKCYEPA